MGQKNVIYVNHNDHVVGSGTIRNAYETGHILRIVRIFILNDKKKLLLQKRSKNMSSYIKWDQSAGGHVDEDETYLQAAKRELFEEMGIQGVALTKIGKFYTEDQPYEHIRRRFNTMYYGIYNGEVTIDTHEVADYLWISLPELNEWTRNKTNDFTDGFLVSYKKLLDSIDLDVL